MGESAPDLDTINRKLDAVISHCISASKQRSILNDHIIGTPDKPGLATRVAVNEANMTSLQKSNSRIWKTLKAAALGLASYFGFKAY